MTQRNSKVNNIFSGLKIACFILFVGCGSNTSHSIITAERDTVYKGGYVDNRKSGEWVTLVKGVVVKREFFIKDTVLLLIEYDSGGTKALYCQFFNHGEVSRQLVFNVREFNNYYFHLDDGLLSQEQKGERLYSYYCRSCHPSVSKDKYLQSFISESSPLDSILLSDRHPTKFKDFDTAEFSCLEKFLR